MRLRHRVAGAHRADDPKQDYGTTRRRGDGREVEALVIAEAQQRAEEEAANQSADDADDKVGDQAVLAAGNLFSDPAGDEADENPGEESHSFTPV